MQITGRHFRNGEPIRVTIDGRTIRSVEPIWCDGDVEELPFLTPGLFDLQINGYGGTWFGSDGITADDVLETLEPHFRYGITRMCPTLITNAHEALLNGFNSIREACEREAWANDLVAGCHLEGPCISTEDGPRGAHPLEHVRPASRDEFEALQAASGNRIRLVTLAPEGDGAIDFIRWVTGTGVVVSIGHTAATSEQIQAAVDGGARLSTHLGNGAHGTIRRHPNYIWEQLGDPRLFASIITDGHHLPASVVRSVIETKTVRRTILTCDAAGLAGCSPGRYSEGSLEVEVLEDGRLVIAGQDQLLAGSGVQTDVCIGEAVCMSGVQFDEAIDMASRNPARLLGCEEVRLRRGSRADIVACRFDGRKLTIEKTVAAGRICYAAT